MKREILTKKRHVCDCCPGHDTFPGDTYRNRTSKHARSRDKKVEHQHIRAIVKREINKELDDL